SGEGGHHSLIGCFPPFSPGTISTCTVNLNLCSGPRNFIWRWNVRLAIGLFLSFACLASAQNPPTSDPQAVALATKSIAALTGGNPVSDVSLTGNVTWTAGSDIEMGTGTFLAKGTGESRVDLN